MRYERRWRRKRRGQKLSGEDSCVPCMCWSGGHQYCCTRSAKSCFCFIHSRLSTYFRASAGERREWGAGATFKRVEARPKYQKCGSKKWLMHRTSQNLVMLEVKNTEKTGSDAKRSYSQPPKGRQRQNFQLCNIRERPPTVLWRTNWRSYMTALLLSIRKSADVRIPN